MIGSSRRRDCYDGCMAHKTFFPFIAAMASCALALSSCASFFVSTDPDNDVTDTQSAEEVKEKKKDKESSKEKKKKNSSLSPSDSDSKDGGFPKPIRDEFMKSCDPTGALTEQCQCTFDKLEATYTLDEFVELSLKTVGSDEKEKAEAEEAVKALAFECIDEIAAKKFSTSDDSDSKVTSSGYAIPSYSDWPVEEVEAFLESCNSSSGGRKEACECAADISLEVPFAEAPQILADPVKGKTLRDRIARECK